MFPGDRPQLPFRHLPAYKNMKAKPGSRFAAKRGMKMESRQKRQAMEELDEKELGKVNGGIVVPINPNGLNPNGNDGIVVPINPNGLNPNGSDGIVVPVNPDD